MHNKAKHYRARVRGIISTSPVHKQLSLILTLALTGCAAAPKITLTADSDLSQLKNLDHCNFNSQCRKISTGYTQCSHISGGGTDILLYSTLIGSKNITTLKELVEKQRLEEKAKDDAYWQSTDQLQECQPYFRLTPKPLCSSNRCVIK